MSAFWALVVDTWRQSKQQSVFILLLILFALVVGVFVVLPKPMTADDGTPAFGFLWSEKPTKVLANSWADQYEMTLQLRDGTMPNPFNHEERKERAERRKEAEARVDELAREVPVLQRSLEYWAFIAASTLFSIGMMLFIAACSGYFPDMLAAGAVDMVVSKPIDRLRIFLGKYIGGLALFGIAVLVAEGLIILGIGIRFGFWPVRLLLAAPLTLFSAAVMYAILACIGIMRRSSTLAIVLGYVFYVVVDTGVSVLIVIGRTEVGKEVPWLGTTARIMHATFPNFALLKSAAEGCVLTIPNLDWEPLLAAAAWLVGALSLGYWRFRRADF